MTKTAEIVERLRAKAKREPNRLGDQWGDFWLDEAADHMESLEARLETAREALREIAETPSMGRGAMQNHARRMIRTLDEGRRTGE